ncbi:MAG: relaxase/mobilization nuclease domain-containing protein [Pyrinomonadaceae bacterium]
MIGKITGGGSFGGALDYLMKPKEQMQEHEKEQYKERLKDAQRTPGESAPAFEAGERHRIIGGNMSSDTRADLAQEFRAISRQRPDIEKPVHHASLSAGKSDKITVEQWNEIAEKYIEQMGFGDAPYVVIQHRDGSTDHIHILTSRVDLEGKVVSDWQCKNRAEKVIREIEREHGLEQVKLSREVERAAPKRGEIERFNRTGELSAKIALQGHVEVALKDSPTATEFINRLQAVGVETIPYIKNSRATGISFRKGDELMKGSDLGPGFSWNALQQRGLDYNVERDRPAIEATRQSASVTRAQAFESPTINTLSPERSVVDTIKDAGTAVGQYALDPANPVKQTQAHVQIYQQKGSIAVEGNNLAEQLLAKENNLESLQRTSEAQFDSRDSFERLQQATGIEPDKTSNDPLERLSHTAKLEQKDQLGNLTQTLNQPQLQEIAPELETAIEEHAVEQTIAMII